MKRNFTCLELLQNSDFINWVKSDEKPSGLWHDWIKNDPENEIVYQKAKTIILSIELEEEESLIEKIRSLWNTIENEIDQT